MTGIQRDVRRLSATRRPPVTGREDGDRGAGSRHRPEQHDPHPGPASISPMPGVHRARQLQQHAARSMTGSPRPTPTAVVSPPYIVTYDGSRTRRPSHDHRRGRRDRGRLGAVNVSATTHTTPAPTPAMPGVHGGSELQQPERHGRDIIDKADATVVVTAYSVTYDGNPHTATSTITGVNGGTGAGSALRRDAARRTPTPAPTTTIPGASPARPTTTTERHGQ